MATITITTIVQWCRIPTTTTRNRIIADMMIPPEGLRHLNGKTSKEMLSTFRDFARRDKQDGNIIFTRVQQRRLISLMYWLKDKTCLEEEASFTYGTTRQELIYKLEEATTRKKCRTVQLSALPSSLNFNHTDSKTTVIRTKKKHGHHHYHHHCSMVQNANHNCKKQNHRWYDDSTRGAETPQW